MKKHWKRILISFLLILIIIFFTGVLLAYNLNHNKTNISKEIEKKFDTEVSLMGVGDAGEQEVVFLRPTNNKNSVIIYELESENSKIINLSNTPRRFLEFICEEDKSAILFSSNRTGDEAYILNLENLTINRITEMNKSPRIRGGYKKENLMKDFCPEKYFYSRGKFEINDIIINFETKQTNHSANSEVEINVVNLTSNVTQKIQNNLDSWNINSSNRFLYNENENTIITYNKMISLEPGYGWTQPRRIFLFNISDSSIQEFNGSGPWERLKEPETYNCWTSNCIHRVYSQYFFMINSSLYAYVNDENYFKYYRGVYKLNENREWEMIKRTPYDIKEEFFFTKDHCNLIHTEEVNENERVTQIDICG